MAQTAVKEEGVAGVKDILFVLYLVFYFALNDVLIFIGICFYQVVAAGAFLQFQYHDVYRVMLNTPGQYPFVEEPL